MSRDKVTLHILKVTLTNEQGEVLEQFDSEGYDLRKTISYRAFLSEVGRHIDNILQRPNIAYDPWFAVGEICEAFDSRIITDLEVLEWREDNETPKKTRSVMAIGGGERAAGIHPYTLTPFFPTYEELEMWCQKRINQFRSYAEKEDPLPDTTKWAEDTLEPKIVQEKIDGALPIHIWTDEKE